MGCEGFESLEVIEVNSGTRFEPLFYGPRDEVLKQTTPWWIACYLIGSPHTYENQACRCNLYLYRLVIGFKHEHHHT